MLILKEGEHMKTENQRAFFVKQKTIIW